MPYGSSTMDWSSDALPLSSGNAPSGSCETTRTRRLFAVGFMAIVSML